MEPLVSTNSVKEGLLRKDSELYRVIVDSMSRISAHLRQESNRIDWESMYYVLTNAGLSDSDCGRVKASFDRCMRELDFLPNSKAVLERMPEHETTTVGTPHCRIVKDWFESFSSTARAHWFEFEDGTSKVRLEKL